MNIQVCSRPALLNRTNSGDEEFDEPLWGGKRRPLMTDDALSPSLVLSDGVVSVSSTSRANNTAIAIVDSDDNDCTKKISWATHKNTDAFLSKSSSTVSSKHKNIQRSSLKSSSKHKHLQSNLKDCVEKNAWKSTCRASFEPTLKKLSSLSSSTSSVSSTSTSDSRSPSWVPGRDTSFTNKNSLAVFYRHLKPSAIRIQSMVRGIQARQQFRQLLLDKVNLARDQKQNKAATCIQARMRGCYGRLKFHVLRLEKKLHDTQSAHQLELHRIETHKNREMERTLRELSEQATLQQDTIVSRRSTNVQIVKELRESNLRLRLDNQEMQEAMIEMAKHSQKLELLTELTNKHISELEKVIPALQAEVDMGQAVVKECQARVEEYETALQNCDERVRFEQKVTHYSRLAIASLLEQVDQGCSDEDLKSDIIETTTVAVENIRTSSSSNNNNTTIKEPSSLDTINEEQ